MDRDKRGIEQEETEGTERHGGIESWVIEYAEGTEGTEVMNYKLRRTNDELRTRPLRKPGGQEKVLFGDPRRGCAPAALCLLVAGPQVFIWGRPACGDRPVLFGGWPACGDRPAATRKSRKVG